MSCRNDMGLFSWLYVALFTIVLTTTVIVLTLAEYGIHPIAP